jgi:hypothetical protein
MLRSVVERAVPNVSSHVEGQAVEIYCFPSTAWALKMNTLPSFETSGTTRKETRRHIPKCTSVSHANHHIAGPAFPLLLYAQRAVCFGAWLGSEPVWMRRDATETPAASQTGGHPLVYIVQAIPAALWIINWWLCQSVSPLAM